MFLYYKRSDTFNYTPNGDPNGNNNSNNDILSYTTQRSQQNNLSSSSHQNRNSERHEQYNTNHSNSERKSTTRPSKKRKQLQQQEIIRTELIPGHRGDRDVDELVMFIDGNSSSKQQQRHNTTAPLRLTDTNSNNTTTTSTRRKSRKPIKILQESSINNNNENKTSPIDEDTQSIGFIDEDDETTSTATVTSTTTHSLDNKYNEQNTTNTSLSNDDESHSITNDINSTNNSNTTNGEITLPEWFEPIRSTSPVNDDNDSFSLSSTTLNNSNSEIISEPFVTVTHRRRLTKERRQDSNPSSSSRTSHFPLSSSSSHNNNNNNNDKRRFQQSSSIQNENVRSTIRNGPLNTQPYVNTATKEEKIDSPSQTVSQTSVLQSPPPSQPPALPVPPTSSISNNSTEQRSPRLSSQSSSSSLSSLLKRQSKPPPVVFLNKSVDVELNDVSFGFDVDNPIIDDKPLTPTLSSPPPPPSTEKEPEILSSTQSNDFLINSKSSSSRRSYQSQQQQQRGNRGPFFYSGPDIRTHNHRNYPSQTPVTQPSYIDPVLLQQYNQQRLANYSQQLAYMNLFRTQYMHSQQPYILIPTTYTATNDNDQDEKILDDETISTSEHIQEPLLVYTPIPTQLGPIYLQQTKKLSNDLEQQMPIPTIYPQQYYYPPQTSHPAYFQPISSPTLILDTKFQQDGSDDEQEEQDNNYEKSTRLFHQTRQQSSSHIMSNALQLVYSQERRNAQTDHFNLDQLTAYLAMKWTDTIDHYEQGNIFEIKI
ncbi:unnamed protein product [Adineta steineri]|uniref:Uncharacterized protein n=1 Tax=Adineta steineri TaxID=433720 RepID=A0A814DV97_9BILA|nr:unnamed protein product [Adineta steineri]CAF0963404.1 unnamed protein product [Adineta steineri]